MRFLLDTNICIYIIKRKPQKVFDKFQTLEIFDIGISSVTIAELEYGFTKVSVNNKIGLHSFSF